MQFRCLTCSIIGQLRIVSLCFLHKSLPAPDPSVYRTDRALLFLLASHRAIPFAGLLHSDHCMRVVTALERRVVSSLDPSITSMMRFHASVFIQTYRLSTPMLSLTYKRPPTARNAVD